MHLDDRRWQAIAECHPILHLNEAEAFWLSGKQEIRSAAAVLRERFKNAVIITQGAEGAPAAQPPEIFVRFKGKARSLWIRSARETVMPVPSWLV